MGYGSGAGASSGAFAMHSALRTGLQAWTITGDAVGMAQGIYNFSNGQESWADTMAFLPAIGGISGIGRNSGEFSRALHHADAVGFAERRTSLLGRWLGSSRLSKSQLQAYQATLEGFGVTVKRGSAARSLLDQLGARAGFDSVNNVVYLRKNATFYDAFHELKHVEHRHAVGQQAYRDLGEYVREAHVFNEVWKNRLLFNRQELEHAIGYIRDERYLHRIGEID